jgi:hypothetical protein
VSATPANKTTCRTPTSLRRVRPPAARRSRRRLSTHRCRCRHAASSHRCEPPPSRAPPSALGPPHPDARARTRCPYRCLRLRLDRGRTVIAALATTIAKSMRGGTAEKSTTPNACMTSHRHNHVGRHRTRRQPPAPSQIRPPGPWIRPPRHRIWASGPRTGSPSQCRAAAVKRGRGNARRREEAPPPSPAPARAPAGATAAAPTTPSTSTPITEGSPPACYNVRRELEEESPVATITAGRAAMPAAGSGGGEVGEEEMGSGRTAACWSRPSRPAWGSNAGDTS